MPDRFTFKDMREAVQECNTVRQQKGANCPTCRQKVILHCTLCKIQVTMCLCTTVEVFGNDEGFKIAVEQYGEEKARDHYRKMGLFVPKNKLIVPGDN